MKIELNKKTIMRSKKQFNLYKLELERLYPNRVNNGCVLFIDITFIWNYGQPIVPSIELIFKDETTKIETFQTCTPHCNKRHKVICTRIGRNKTREGIPFLFENFNEMSQIKKIRYIWHAQGYNSEMLSIPEMISIHDYAVIFENTGSIYALKVLDARLTNIVNSTYLPLIETKKNYEFIVSIQKNSIVPIKVPTESEQTLVFEKPVGIELDNEGEINYFFRNIKIGGIDDCK